MAWHESHSTHAGVTIRACRGAHLGHHARVPQLDHAVRVRGRQRVAQQVEAGGVAAVVVAVEGLRAQPGARVPDGDGLVGGGGGQVGAEGQPAGGRGSALCKSVQHQ